MRRIFAAFSFLLCGSLALAAGSVSYSLDIDITPGNQAGTYLCKAVVTDLETGKVFSAPFVTLVAASPASTKTADGDLVSEFTVSVDSKTSRATAELKDVMRRESHRCPGDVGCSSLGGAVAQDRGSSGLAPLRCARR